jgi:predicted AAA+ superfamily ATPase
MPFSSTWRSGGRGSHCVPPPRCSGPGSATARGEAGRYWANVGKRLTKSPKVYLRDSGLLHTLLGLPTLDALRSHPKIGASWEGWVIGQIIGVLRLAGEAVQAYFWRTHGGAEVDLLLVLRDRLVPVEIKMGGEPAITRGLIECMKDLKVTRGFVMHGGPDSYPLGKNVWAVSAGLLAHEHELGAGLLDPSRMVDTREP